MSQPLASSQFDPSIRSRATALFRQHQHEIFVRTDRMFAALMVLQWLASIAAAYLISPYTWSGPYSQIHIHVWAALLLGGTITAAPVVLAWRLPGATITRHVIAVSQMLTSALLIHLTGGRIETHFHVFGSLAFLAFYRDWKVLITATVVVAADHYLRGIFWPQSVYGVLTASWWRSMEHAGWVVFEDVILLRWCWRGIREIQEIALRTAELEATNARIEQTVVERTAELRASEERAQTILEMSNDPFIAIDSKGKIVDWNSQAELTFGWTRNEAVGQCLTDTIIPLQYCEAHLAGIARFLETGEGPILRKRLEMSALNRAGNEFPVEMTISPIRLANDWLFSGFVRDITSRKQTEADLRQAKEHAESANRAKSEFLANMSHEIRTPLNGIVGMTELALDTPLTNGQREYLSTVKSCADSLLTVINDILDFSKIEAGKLQMDQIGFCLGEVLGETCKALGLCAHQKKLELACRLPASVPDNLVGDPGRLRQVLVNLIGNAIKFTKQGEIFVQAEVQSQTDKDVLLHFMVRDTGIGIPPEKQELIFKAFEQADTSTTRTYGGTGLGLSIALRLINLMGGKIWVESEVGTGSTFHFTARFEINLAATPPRAVETPTALENMRVLVVDDNDTNRKILDETLRHWRMQPTLAASGEEALSVLEQATTNGAPFPLVLLDCHMPEMDGFALVERIKANAKITGAQLMMLSSANQLNDAQRCRELGVSAYLTKPIKQSELLDTILLIAGPPAPPTEAEKKTRPLLVKPAATETRKLQILLAEDNPVNQRVAAGILEKRGHTVVVVENGLEALEALRMQRFDVVLMDLQMPEMDGFAATAAIRQLEQTTKAHLPIIAMTARAMKGDRESCLEAGMDGYVSKPVNPKDLISAIETHVRPLTKPSSTTSNGKVSVNGQKAHAPEAATDTELATNVPSNTEPAIDFAGLLARVENDTTLLEEMIGLYLDTSPRLLVEIETGVARQDAAVLQRAAHTLKGALQNLSADPGAQAAFQLEKLGRGGNLATAEASLAELKRELTRLQSEIMQWSKEVLV